jgi:hypothetical protein
VLSLYLPSPHAALYDRGKFIGCTGSVPSPMTLALRRKPNGSALPKFPSSVSDGGWFRGFTGSLLRCGLSSCSPPCTDLTRHFSQPTGTFTPELPASRSPFSSSGITTVAPERLHRWDFHPLERQLASLHRLFHPLVGSKTGAMLRRFSLAVSPRFLWECLSSQTVSWFPAPASSNPAGGFPALGFPVCFVSQVMRLLQAGRAFAADVPRCTRYSWNNPRVS